MDASKPRVPHHCLNGICCGNDSSNRLPPRSCFRSCYCQRRRLYKRPTIAQSYSLAGASTKLGDISERCSDCGDAQCGVTRRLAPLLSLIIAAPGKIHGHCDRVHRASLARRDKGSNPDLQPAPMRAPWRPSSRYPPDCPFPRDHLRHDLLGKITDNRLHPMPRPR